MTRPAFLPAPARGVSGAVLSLLHDDLKAGRRVLVRLADNVQREQLNQYLWVHGDGSFLPHGVAEDGHAERQPVYLTCGTENPNGAAHLLLVGGADASVAEIQAVPKVTVVFDRRDPVPARQLWRACAEAGLEPALLRRDRDGQWRPAEEDAKDAQAQPEDPAASAGNADPQR